MFILILDSFYLNEFYRSWLKSWRVWQSAAAFGGQKLQKAETNRGFVLLRHRTVWCHIRQSSAL